MELPKRPEIRKTSSNFLQSLPPPLLPQFPAPNPFFHPISLFEQQQNFAFVEPLPKNPANTTKFDFKVSQEQSNDPFVYPQDSSEFQKPLVKLLQVGSAYEVPSYRLDDEIDPFKFVEDKSKASGLIISTTPEWRSLNIGTIPNSLWFNYRTQVFNKPSGKLSKNRALWNLHNRIMLQGGLENVQRLDSWDKILSESGLNPADREKYQTIVSEMDQHIHKKLKLSKLPVISNSSYEYKRSRQRKLLKGFPVNFDSNLKQIPEISDPDSALYLDWFSRNKCKVDNSIYNDRCTLQDFVVKNAVLENLFTGDSVEDLENQYWNLVDNRQALEINTASRVITHNTIFSHNKDSTWNLNNLSSNNRSLLKYSSFEYTAYPTMSVGTLFSTENWTKEDHLLSLIDFNHFGAPKLWYFIDPQDTTKFEKQLSLLDTKEVYKRIHKDAFFSRYTNPTKSSTEYLLSPEYLKLRGINVRKMVQKPGEFIIKNPNVYSYSISMGFTINESVNFAPLSWLNHALDSELYLKKHGILSGLSTFDILVNIAKNCQNPSIVSLLNAIFPTLCDKELEMRDKLRSVVPDLLEKINRNLDFYYPDDDLSISVPSVVYMISKDENQFSMSLDSFLQHYELDKSKFDTNVVHYELVVLYEDEKLRQFTKSLQKEITTSSDWLQKVQSVLGQESKPSLRMLKQLHTEGEKVFTKEYLTTVYNETNDGILYNSYLQLGEKIDFFVQWTELAQKYSSSKHTSRKRKGKRDEETEQSENLSLSSLCEMIQQIPQLSFYTEEMDQLITLSMEIEDYENSARKFISNKSMNLEELENILSLGKSFGIDLPSVAYLEEYKNTESWLKKYEDSSKVGLVEVFKDLNALKEFVDNGKNIPDIKDNHRDKITKLERICEITSLVNARGDKILNRSQKQLTIDEIDDTIQESYKYPVDLQLRIDLIRLQSEYEEILQKSRKFIELIDQKSDQPKFQQIKTLLLKYHQLKVLIPETKKLDDEYFKKTDQWLKALKRSLNRVNHSTSSLKQFIQSLSESVTQTIASPDDLELLATSGPSSNSNIYCVCRRGESGLMVECEVCSEWYHLGCFNLNKVKMKNKDFICPICEEKPGETKPTIQDLKELVSRAKELKYLPLDEYESLERICQDVDEFVPILHKNLGWKNGEFEETDINKLRFYLRKLIGCPVEIESYTSDLQKLLTSQMNKESLIKLSEIASLAIKKEEHTELNDGLTNGDTKGVSTETTVDEKGEAPKNEAVIAKVEHDTNGAGLEFVNGNNSVHSNGIEGGSEQLHLNNVDTTKKELESVNKSNGNEGNDETSEGATSGNSEGLKKATVTGELQDHDAAQNVNGLRQNDQDKNLTGEVVEPAIELKRTVSDNSQIIGLKEVGKNKETTENKANSTGTPDLAPLNVEQVSQESGNGGENEETLKLEQAPEIENTNSTQNGERSEIPQESEDGAEENGEDLPKSESLVKTEEIGKFEKVEADKASTENASQSQTPKIQDKVETQLSKGEETADSN